MRSTSPGTPHDHPYRPLAQAAAQHRQAGLPAAGRPDRRRHQDGPAGRARPAAHAARAGERPGAELHDGGARLCRGAQARADRFARGHGHLHSLGQPEPAAARRQRRRDDDEHAARARRRAPDGAPARRRQPRLRGNRLSRPAALPGLRRHRARPRGGDAVAAALRAACERGPHPGVPRHPRGADRAVLAAGAPRRAGVRGVADLSGREGHRGAAGRAAARAADGRRRAHRRCLRARLQDAQAQGAVLQPHAAEPDRGHRVARAARGAGRRGAALRGAHHRGRRLRHAAAPDAGFIGHAGAGPHLLRERVSPSASVRACAAPTCARRRWCSRSAWPAPCAPPP
jgi:hypothetical protein